jgi:hypothetical protein
VTALTFADATVPRCARGCVAPGECPWDGEPLCWDCVGLELDILAAAATAGALFTVCRSTGSPQAGGKWRDRRGQAA